jgi:hypothetical protein
MAITPKKNIDDGKSLPSQSSNNDEFTPRRATRSAAKLRLAIDGAAGSGKTFSALEIAFGLTDGKGKIVVIDTENQSADLYAHLGEYDTVPLNPPYTPERYITAIKKMEELGKLGRRRWSIRKADCCDKAHRQRLYFLE